MALLVAVTAPSGLVVNQSYARIESISGSKNSLDIALFFYLNQASASNGKEPIYRTYLSFDPSVDDGAPNFIKQGYEYLKTLPEFANAIDVLEE